MDDCGVLPDKPIKPACMISDQFLTIGIDSFIDACRYVHRLPYGYNSNRDDLMILFKEKMGTCTTKHAVIATLAAELSLAITKSIGIYAMNEIMVSGTDKILKKYNLPYVPMLHCFLEYGPYRIDLTEGNHNGKNSPIENFLHTVIVKPDITEKEEYALYRNALKNYILTRDEMDGVDVKTVLHARAEGIALLKSNLDRMPLHHYIHSS